MTDVVNLTAASEDRSEKNFSISIRHKAIKKVTEDIHRHSFNTAVAALMEYVNELYKTGATTEDKITLAKLLKPFAPHLASEMLEHLQADDEWPQWDDKDLVSDTAEVVIQINGKLRAKLQVATDDLQDHDKLQQLALAEPKIQKHLDGAEPKKIIIPPHNKLINIVI